MYSSTKSSAAYHSSPPPAPASTNYAFLAKPPKFKHKPQPITVRCVPPRSLPRPTSSRRRASVSGSPAVQTSFITLVETPTPTSDTPKTPHLTTHGYTAAFSTLYHRRGSLPDTPRSARRSPTSPKRGSTPRSAPSSPKRATGSGSPKRRTHRVPTPTSPFSPPSPTRPQTRPRAKSTTTRIPAPAPASTLAPPPRTPKLSKIRSFTNLRSRSPSPAPPSRATSPMAAATTTAKQTPKRSKRSATPAHGSAAYAKYRPMPFIQQMQMIQFLEGGTLESHIRRHHVHAGQGTAHTGFAVGPDDEIAHGYAFTDERGMIWFDEEEEWEFACLLPQARRQPKRGIKRLLGKRRVEESEEEWEEFVEEGVEQEDDVVDPDVLLAREDDDLHAGQDDLAAFGGALEGAWGRDRPERSVLKLPEPKHERKTKRQRRRVSKVTPPSPAPPPPPTKVLKQEFLASAFAPSPASSLSSSLQSAPATPRATSPFRRFASKAHHRHARSLSNVATNAPANPGAGQSFASLGSTLRGGSVLDADVSSSPSPSVQWAYTTALAPPCDPASRQPSPAPVDPRLRSVSPPPAAARRLGIDPTATVSLQPVPIKKPSFMGLRGFKSTR